MLRLLRTSDGYVGGVPGVRRPSGCSPRRRASSVRIPPVRVMSGRLGGRPSSRCRHEHEGQPVTHHRNDALADVRSAGFGITPPGGHPSELIPDDFDFGPEPGNDDQHRGHDGPMPLMQFDTAPEEAARFIPQLVAAGSDYIKFMIDDGSVEGHPGLPMLDQPTLDAGVAEARRHGMLTLAHTGGDAGSRARRSMPP